MSTASLINDLISNASLLLVGLYAISRLTRLGFTQKLPFRRQVSIAYLLAGLSILITLHGVLWNAETDFQYGFVPIIISALYFGLPGVRITYVTSIFVLPFILTETLLVNAFWNYSIAILVAVIFLNFHERIISPRDIRIVNGTSLVFITLFSLLNFHVYENVWTFLAFITIGYTAGFFIDIVYGGIHKMQRSERLISQYKEAAFTDALTGIGNRRRFEEEMKLIDEEVFTGTQDITLLLLDIDRFKSINDTYGHDAGDAILVELAKRLSDMARSNDVLCRNGGEEFTVLLSDCNLSQGFVIGKRYLRQIAEAPFVLPSGLSIDITVSIGIASTSEVKVLTSSQLMKKADVGLYVAKRSGRNRIGKWNEKKAN